MVSLKKEQRMYSKIASGPPIILRILQRKRTNMMWLHKEEIFLGLGSCACRGLVMPKSDGRG